MIDSSAPEQRAAQYLLRKIVFAGLLPDTLHAMGVLEKADDAWPLPSHDAGYVRHFLEDAAQPTGLPVRAIERPLREHLEQVAAFSRSDGGSSPDNGAAVERLIRSGRVELFAR